VNDLEKNTQVKIGSERSFGIVFTVVFLVLGLYPVYHGEDFNLPLISVGFVLLLITISAPSLFYWPNRAWFKFGLLLGAIVAPIVMALVYCIIFVPIGLWFKLVGKDPLNRKIDKGAKTYWIVRNKDMQSMKRQF